MHAQSLLIAAITNDSAVRYVVLYLTEARGYMWRHTQAIVAELERLHVINSWRNRFSDSANNPFRALA